MDCTIDINPLFYSPHDMAGFIAGLYTQGLKFKAELVSIHCLRFTIAGC